MTDEAATPAKDAHALCRQKLTEADRSDYYSALFAPADRQPGVFALYAFWHEVREIIDECSEPEIAHRKLAWWRDEIQAMYAGGPRHPVAVALSPTLLAHRLPQDSFVAIIDELVRHTHMPHYSTFDERRRHAADSRGRVQQLVALLCGQDDATTPGHALQLGALQALAIELRDVGADARRGRVYLADEDLARFGVTPEDICAGRENDGFRALVAFEAERLLSETTRVLDLITPVDRRRQLPLVIGANITSALLREIRADSPRVLSHRLALTPLRQLWIAWRSARRWRRAA